jgi:hypothetical protein
MLEDTESSPTWSAREWLLTLAAEWRALDHSLKESEHKIQRGFRHSEACQRLPQMEGLGPHWLSLDMTLQSDALMAWRRLD